MGKRVLSAGQIHFMLVIISLWVLSSTVFVIMIGVQTERIEQKQKSIHTLSNMVQALNEDLAAKDVKIALQKEKVAKLRKSLLAGTGEWNVDEAVITAYSPLDDQNGINSQGDPTTTSIGMKVGYGKFAVDPARIPYGSKILIIYEDGTTEEGIAADTGGALRNAEHIAIDVFRQTFNEAIRFGDPEATVVWWEPEAEEE